MTEDGEIITPERRSSISNDFLIKKRQNRLKDKGYNSSKREAEKTLNEAIIIQNSIFENNLICAEDDERKSTEIENE